MHVPTCMYIQSCTSKQMDMLFCKASLFSVAVGSLEMDPDTIKRSRNNLREYIVLNLNVASNDTRNARSVTSLARESNDSNDQFRGFTNGDGDFLSKSLRPLSELLGVL